VKDGGKSFILSMNIATQSAGLVAELRPSSSAALMMALDSADLSRTKKYALPDRKSHEERCIGKWRIVQVSWRQVGS